MDIQFQSTPGPLASAITGAADSLGVDVANGGTTADTVLTLSGIGTQHTVVYIFDNQTLLRTASVISLGTWELTATVELGRHAFTVRDALAGGDSAEWVINVAEAELDLKPPTVVQAPDGILDPMDAISGATVVVSYDDMQTTDTIGLSWNGLDNLVQPQPGSTLGSVTFTIPASAVAAVIGKTIPVLYAVVRNGVGKPSWELSLTVETLSESVLEAPRILQASEDGSLDVRALAGDAELKVRPWPFIDAGQQISLRFEGTKADGSAYTWTHPTWQNLPISSPGEPSTTVALSHLRELKDSSSLTLIFEVSFDGGVTKVPFPVRVLSVIQLASGFEGFESAIPGPLPFNAHLILPSGLSLFRDENLSFPAATIVRAGSQQGEHGFQYLSLNHNGTEGSIVGVYLPVGDFKKLKFTLWVASMSGGNLKCSSAVYDSHGYWGHTEHVLTESRILVEYIAPAGRIATYIYFDMNGYSQAGAVACDSFSWSE